LSRRGFLEEKPIVELISALVYAYRTERETLIAVRGAMEELARVGAIHHVRALKKVERDLKDSILKLKLHLRKLKVNVEEI